MPCALNVYLAGLDGVHFIRVHILKILPKIASKLGVDAQVKRAIVKKVTLTLCSPAGSLWVPSQLPYKSVFSARVAVGKDRAQKPVKRIQRSKKCLAGGGYRAWRRGPD